jgi:hypothetical protein
MNINSMQKLLLPTTFSDQGDSNKHKKILHKQHTLFFNQTRERKPKNQKEGERD